MALNGHSHSAITLPQLIYLTDRKYLDLIFCSGTTNGCATTMARKVDHVTLEAIRMRSVTQIRDGARVEDVAAAWGQRLVGSIGPTRQRALSTLRDLLEAAGYGHGDAYSSC